MNQWRFENGLKIRRNWTGFVLRPHDRRENNGKHYYYIFWWVVEWWEKWS